MKKLIGTLKLSRLEWLRQRKFGIGGSDVSGIAGISNYNNAFTVYLSKVDPNFVEQEENDPMMFGNLLEPVVAEVFTKKTGIKLKKCNYILQHEEYPYMIANVDRMVIGETDAGFEAKTGRSYTSSQWSEQDDPNVRIPDSYMLQVQHYMLVTGFAKWYVAVLLDTSDFRWYTILRDEQMIENIKAIEINFWENHVLKEMPPLMDGSDCASKYLKEKYDRSQVIEGEIELIGIEEEIVKIKEAKEQIDFYTKIKDGAENRIKDQLGNNEYGRCPNGQQITWKFSKNEFKFDSDRFKKEMPDVYDSFKTKPDDSRRFTIVKMKEVK